MKIFVDKLPDACDSQCPFAKDKGHFVRTGAEESEWDSRWVCRLGKTAARCPLEVPEPNKLIQA